MCDKCDGKIMLTVGEIKGIVEGIKDAQSKMHDTVTTNRIAAQKDIKELSDNVTKFKLKVFGTSAVFGSVAGFLSRYMPS